MPLWGESTSNKKYTSGKSSSASAGVSSSHGALAGNNTNAQQATYTGSNGKGSGGQSGSTAASTYVNNSGSSYANTPVTYSSAGSGSGGGGGFSGSSSINSGSSAAQLAAAQIARENTIKAAKEKVAAEAAAAVKNAREIANATNIRNKVRAENAAAKTAASLAAQNKAAADLQNQADKARQAQIAKQYTVKNRVSSKDRETSPANPSESSYSDSNFFNRMLNNSKTSMATGGILAAATLANLLPGSADTRKAIASKVGGMAGTAATGIGSALGLNELGNAASTTMDTVAKQALSSVADKAVPIALTAASLPAAVGAAVSKPVKDLDNWLSQYESKNDYSTGALTNAYNNLKTMESGNTLQMGDAAMAARNFIDNTYAPALNKVGNYINDNGLVGVGRSAYGAAKTYIPPIIEDILFGANGAPTTAATTAPTTTNTTSGGSKTPDKKTAAELVNGYKSPVIGDKTIGTGAGTGTGTGTGGTKTTAPKTPATTETTETSSEETSETTGGEGLDLEESINQMRSNYGITDTTYDSLYSDITAAINDAMNSVRDENKLLLSQASDAKANALNNLYKTFTDSIGSGLTSGASTGQALAGAVQAVMGDQETANTTQETMMKQALANILSIGSKKADTPTDAASAIAQLMTPESNIRQYYFQGSDAASKEAAASNYAADQSLAAALASNTGSGSGSGSSSRSNSNVMTQQQMYDYVDSAVSEDDLIYKLSTLYGVTEGGALYNSLYNRGMKNVARWKAASAADPSDSYFDMINF